MDRTALTAHDRPAGEAPAQHAYRLPYHWCMSPFHQYVVRQAVERVAEVLQGRSVLDVGCGDGFATALVARHARTVHGIDISERAVAFAHMIVEEPHVTFEVGAAGDLERLAPRPVEVVTAFEVIEHLPAEELDVFLSAARTVLSETGGWLVLTTPNGRRHGRERNPHHAREFRPEELGALIEGAGFAKVGIEGLYLQPPWAGLEHFANTVPFRPLFRALARGGKRRPRWCRTLLCRARLA